MTGGDEPAVRLYLTGGLAIQGPDRIVRGDAVVGRQGRLALAYLILERRRGVSSTELIDALWAGEPPRAAEQAVRSLISKLRASFAEAGIDGSSAIVADAGAYRLRLPSGSWVDVEAAAESLEEAESTLRAGDTARAWAAAMVTGTIARRDLLPGEDAPWITSARERLDDLLFRALICLSVAALDSDDTSLAGQLAIDAVARQPFREIGHRQLMQVELAQGQRAEALRVYQRCRALLVEELGVGPSAETERLYLEALRHD